jgi:hypothetical protein
MDKQKKDLFLLVKSAIKGEKYSLGQDVDTQKICEYARCN